MEYKYLLDKIIALAEDIVKLKIENVKLKEELKHEKQSHEQKPVKIDEGQAKMMFIWALEKVEERTNKGYKLTDNDKNSWWNDFKTYALSGNKGDQNPTDKVEPKFHEGEWLCENKPNNYARFIQILEIVNVQGKDRYRISRDIHKDEDIVEFGFVEKHYHKFDIQDAKDGDVLVNQNGEMPFIFKECKGNHIYCYCGYTNRKDIFFNKFVDSKGEELHWLNLYHEQAYPATEEQRELLFVKMKEAGYERDTEKKEVKKIKQKPAWNREDEQNLNAALGYIDDEYLRRWLKDAIYNKYEKPTWSEEDEKRIKNIISVLDVQVCWNGATGKKENPYQEEIDWLKSIKERCI